MRYIIISALLLLGVLYPKFSGARERVYSDLAVKAAYLLNIAQFVTFSEKQPLELCIIGNEAIGMFAATEQTNNPERYQALRILKRHPSDSLQSCDIIYIDLSRVDDVSRILYKAGRALTISDIPDFLGMGGMIELATVQNKVQLYVHIENARAHHVTVSAKLLGYAKRVVGK